MLVKRMSSSSAFVNQDKVNAARQACKSLVEQSDRNAYILNAFLPPTGRDAHLALRAFNIQTAQVADQVSNASLGRRRLQYWKDAIEGLYTDRGSPEPSMILLAALSSRGIRFTKQMLARIPAARGKYLGNKPFPSMAALEGYSENTYSTLMYLTLEGMNIRSEPLDHVASHIGMATGITAILRAVPFMASKGNVILPVDICAEEGVRQEDVKRHGAYASSVQNAIFAIATKANDHMMTARKMITEMTPMKQAPGFPVLLESVPTSLYLERLEKVNFDVFHPSLSRREWKLPYRAYKAYAFRRI